MKSLSFVLLENFPLFSINCPGKGKLLKERKTTLTFFFVFSLCTLYLLTPEMFSSLVPKNLLAQLFLYWVGPAETELKASNETIFLSRYNFPQYSVSIKKSAKVK